MARVIAAIGLPTHALRFSSSSPPQVVVPAEAFLTSVVELPSTDPRRHTPQGRGSHPNHHHHNRLRKAVNNFFAPAENRLFVALRGR